jgi:hypothetical protein
MATIHEEIDSWLAADLHEQLSEEDRRAFHLHLVECADCRKIHQETKTMNKMLEETLATDKPDPAFEQRMLSKFRDRVPQRRNLGSLIADLMRLRATQITAVAAMLLALVQMGRLITGEEGEWSGASIARKAKSAPYEEGQSVAGLNIPTGEEDAETGPDKPLPAASPGPELTAAGQTKSSRGAWSDWETPNAAKPDKAQTDLIADHRFRNLEGAKDKSEIASFGKSTAGPAAAGGGEILRNGNYAGRMASAASELKETNQPQSGHRSQESGANESSIAADVANRKVIRNAQVELEVVSFQDTAQKITDFANEGKGYIATSNSQKQANGKLRGQVVVKVLPENLDPFLQKIRALGELKNQTLGSDDVTKQYLDTDARLKNARVMEQRKPKPARLPISCRWKRNSPVFVRKSRKCRVL